MTRHGGKKGGEEEQRKARNIVTAKVVYNCCVNMCIDDVHCCRGNYPRWTSKATVGLNKIGHLLEKRERRTRPSKRDASRQRAQCKSEGRQTNLGTIAQTDLPWANPCSPQTQNPPGLRRS